METLSMFRFYYGILILTLCFSCKNEQEEAMEIEAFSLSEVKLLEGPIKHAVELNQQTLLLYEPDRLLSRFRSEAGLEPKAEPYGGWESESLAGHSLGHYLSACSMMYQVSGEQEYLDRVKYIVDELEAVQEADGDGYLGAFSNGKAVFEQEIASGQVEAQSFNLNGIWAPFYTHHKVMAGLRDAYRLLGINKALVIEQKFADWIYTIVSGLNEEQIQLMLDCEHGGINEVLVDLYLDTNNSRYLEMSYTFHHKVVLDSLARRNDILPGIHANTQIPKLIGLAKRYEVDHRPSDYQAASFFWDRVVNHHSYVTGGHGNHEYFGSPDQLNFRLGSGTTETCNVYNMLKLSDLLFRLEPQAGVADFYERALFNHILSAQHPKTGKVIYNLSLEMGGHKHYQDPFGFTCCVGSGMETHSKYGGTIYYHGKDQFYVNQFIASEVNWKSQEAVITQLTDFPEKQESKLLLELDQPRRFELLIRQPYWAEVFSLSVNGEPAAYDLHDNGYAAIDRLWKSGDEVQIELPFELHIEAMPDNPNRIAMMYGPLVLASDLGPDSDTQGNEEIIPPIIITEIESPLLLFEPTDEPNHFKLRLESGESFIFKPFYAIHDRRYSVYHDWYNQEEMIAVEAAQEKEKERRAKLISRTYDYFQPGDEDSEHSHEFQGDSVYVQEFKGRKARVANREGSFSFKMNLIPNQSMALVAEYWGGFTGGKTFDIMVNGEKVATENISGKKDGHFIDVTYELPQSTRDSEIIEIAFLPHKGSRAGPLFGMRTIRIE